PSSLIENGDTGSCDGAAGLGNSADFPGGGAPNAPGGGPPAMPPGGIIPGGGGIMPGGGIPPPDIGIPGAIPGGGYWACPWVGAIPRPQAMPKSTPSFFHQLLMFASPA